MKKMIGILVILMLVLACTAAMADEVPEPEGGKKFDSNWAAQNLVIEIAYEEEGYRVFIEKKDFEAMSGIRWEYSCYYKEEEDALVSVTSSKAAFIMDEDDVDELQFDTPEYEDFDAEDNSTVFTMDESGHILWKDGRGNDGEGLAFINIGLFEGSWMNETEKVDVEFTWNGQDGGEFYNVWMQRGDSNEDTFVIFEMTGVYNAETGKLECTGTAFVNTKNAQGDYEIIEDGETYDAFFSRMEDGKVLFETENGIELEAFKSNG